MIRWFLRLLFGVRQPRWIVKADSPLEAIRTLPFRPGEEWPKGIAVVASISATPVVEGYWEIEVKYE